MIAKEQIAADLAELRTRSHNLGMRIDDCEHQAVDYRLELAEVVGEIRGLERVRDLLMLVPGEADPPARHSVQRPVMKLLRDVGPLNPVDEETIAAKTMLPRASVHEFLIRALRKGDVVTGGGGLYSLPGEPDAGEQREAAE